MRVGFTGTRDGLTPAQGGALARRVRDQQVTTFHHGACFGADAEAVVHVRHYHPEAHIVAHPCTLTKCVSERALAASDHKRDVRPPLDRNRDIVDTADVMFACPKGPEELRSGTWSTVRYARKRGVPVVIFWPDGTMETEGDFTTNTGE